MNNPLLPGSSIPFTAPALVSSGLPGATQPSRYVGATSGGPPTSGSFQVGDFVIDQTGAVWICTTSGTPGSWSLVGAVPVATQSKVGGVKSGGAFNVNPDGTTVLNPASPTKVGGVTLPQSAGNQSTPVSIYRASVTKDLLVTSTTSTTVVSYTPVAEGQFKVSGYFSVANAATSVTITLTYTSPSGSQSWTLVPTYTLPIGDYVIPARTIDAIPTSPITLSITAGMANNITISAVIEGV